MFKGSIVALVTPFSDGKVDEIKLAELIEFHIANGTDAIVSCGTTGESATMSHEEDIAVTKFVIKAVNKRIPVIAGTGSNNTREAIYITEAAKLNGADAALIVAPYYNKPTQEGLYLHYKKIAETVDIPMILYNVPGRTGGAGILPETVVRLSKIPGITAIKEASGTVDNASQILKELPGFNVLSGDDGITLPMMALGAQGVVSVAANVIPDKIANMCKLALKGDFAGARKIHFECHDLFKALFYESNPIPVKTALNLMGAISGELRLPLSPMGEDAKARLIKVMKNMGLIK
ncbi:MAG: 4-hydroxy-tetrahydrodipicolinate synthase [Deferribacteraceae bacterium]|jgi:4-hydroxy-tetrahydrodipicolinate synthase|nr:4-hydroxy-tetrahydrodipicolinate synthase [Deferribacteraceae bacterium]